MGTVCPHPHFIIFNFTLFIFFSFECISKYLKQNGSHETYVTWKCHQMHISYYQHEKKHWLLFPYYGYIVVKKVVVCIGIF